MVRLGMWASRLLSNRISSCKPSQGQRADYRLLGLSPGKTKQYHNLNALLDRYSPDLRIIGVPCNQFGQQEPGKNLEEILNGIKHVRPGGGFVPKFELTKKMNVNGEKENEFYTFLKSHFPPMKDVAWNFEKFLIDRQGRVRYRMEDGVLPDENDVTERIEELKREKDD